MRSGGAEAAWRGYRLQALHALWRIVTSADPERLVFQPEGREDLAVFDSAGRLAEASQVKARSDPLTISDFEPEKPDSFFHRVVETCKAHPDALVKMVSFGPIGREIRLAWQTHGPERRSIQRKLSDHGFTVEDVGVILDRVELVPLEEDRVQKDLFAFLTQTLAGVDPAHAFESLQFWIWSASENRETITRDTLIRKINNVGRFLAARASHHGEWFTSIVPIEDADIHDAKRETLAEEFYQGIAARYEHILANTDVVRDRKLAEVEKAFRTAKTVIIHAASGQGKSTLAYRYLHDYFPQQWRFQVRAIQDRQHALRIARALAEHARAVGVPVVVYVDVSARDRDWPELVAELAREDGLQALVTIREEDWRRAPISAVQFQYGEVELTFDETEARELYDGLASRLQPDAFLNFEDAWRRFRAAGPLLEFVYLVTQNQSLHERLKEQVRSLEDEVRTGALDADELEFLRLVSVAAAYEAHLDLTALAGSLSLPAPRRTLELFEREYLLRRSGDGRFVGGLHPIRSGILAGYLTDPVFHPWATKAKACLPMIAEQDLEVFLLYAFSRRATEARGLVATLSQLQPRTWTGLAGALRSLLWLGVQEYVQNNRELIGEVSDKFGAGWSYVLDPDLAGVSPGFDVSWWQRIQSVPDHAKAEIASFQARQTPKQDVFLRAAEWLAGRERRPDAPTTLSDWAALAEAVFWVAHLSVDSQIPSWLSEADLDSAATTLPLESLSDVLVALSFTWGARFVKWLECNRSVLLERFRRHTRTIVVEDDGRAFRAHFIVDFSIPGQSPPVDGTTSGSAGGDLHAEALWRIELARKLFPDRQEYGCQGYGHRLGPLQLPFDDTAKSGIPVDSMPPPWPVGINSHFRYLGMYPLRPQAWGGYAQAVLDMRELVVDSLQDLAQALVQHFRKQKALGLLREHIDGERWAQCRANTTNPPLLPQCAVDEWGFVGEGKREEISPDGTSRPLLSRTQNGMALWNHKRYLEAIRELTFALAAFYDQSVHVLATNSSTAKAGLSARQVETLLSKLAAEGVKSDLAHLSTYNLAEAVKALPQFQREFRQRFSQFLDSDALERLEKRESDTYRRAWSVWYQFAYHPARVWQHAEMQAMAKLNNVVSSVRRNLRRRLRSLSEEGIQSRVVSETVPWEGNAALWIAFDVANPLRVYQAHQSVIQALKQAIGNVEDDQLKRYGLELSWPWIVFVPLVGDRCLAQSAWCMSMLVLLSRDVFGQDDWWNYSQRPVPNDAWDELGLTLCDDQRMELAADLGGAMASLALHVAHLHDLTRLPERDEQGVQLLHDHVEEFGAKTGHALQRVLELAGDMLDHLKGLGVEDLEERPACVAATQILAEMRGNLLPQEGFEGSLEMDLKSMGEWMVRLSSAVVQAEALRLCWAADVLGLPLDSLEAPTETALDCGAGGSQSD
ncbi:MAG TPA: hypothetical protein VM537_19015 [Anaerolineae bacterium]|nr:hypothetical protein [Anaerolineae bacterium]